MRNDIKRILEGSFVAPEPKRKEEFFREIDRTPISIFDFVKLQISYIRKRVWILSVIVMMLSIVSKKYVGVDCIWVISAMMPFVAVSMVSENNRSEIYGMAELEQTSRFSLKSVMYARLVIVGVSHLMFLSFIIPFVGNGILMPHMQIGIYILVPYLLASTMGVIAVRRNRGKENSYYCFGISCMVSCLQIIVREIIPQIYDGKWFPCWIAVFLYLLMRLCAEYKKIIYTTEDMLWN